MKLFHTVRALNPFFFFLITSQAACPMTVPPAPNPNLANCSQMPGDLYAAPVILHTDCWQDDPTELVLRGVRPPQGRQETVEIKTATGDLTALSGTLINTTDLGCFLNLEHAAHSVACTGPALSDKISLSCEQADKTACRVVLETPEKWRRYDPLGDFPKYIDEDPEPMRHQ